MRKLLTTIALSVVLLAQGGVHIRPALANEPAPTTGTARYEVDFMTGMIDHHGMAIAMAKICLQEAIHPELRAMCEEIITAQQAEIAQMQGWLAAWYAISYEPHMSAGNMMKMEQRAALEGGDFEIRFMESMIRHHWRAVVEARTCSIRAYHPALAQMCGGIIEMQISEIAQLETWLCSWYMRCRERDNGRSMAETTP